MSTVLERLRDVSTGSLLRIEHGQRVIEGTLAQVTADGIVLKRGEVMEAIGASGIVAVRRRATYALTGALIGGIAGLLVGMFLAIKAAALTFGFIGANGIFIIAGALAVLGGLLGAALGAWVPRWKTIWP